MTFEQADKLFTLIMESYGEQTGLGQTERNIIHGLGTGQFVIKIKKGKVKWFATYWRLSKEDVERVKQAEPATDVCHGEFIYITEAVVITGKQGMKEMISALRAKAQSRWAYWHRHKKGSKFCLAARRHYAK